MDRPSICWFVSNFFVYFTSDSALPTWCPHTPMLMPRWQVVAAKLGQYALYALMEILMLSGIMSAIFASDPMLVFGLYDLAFANHNVDSINAIRAVHEFYTRAIIAIIFIHVAAAIYHHFVVKDETMVNMTKFWITRRSPVCCPATVVCTVNKAAENVGLRSC